LIAAHRTRGWGCWNPFNIIETTCSKFLSITWKQQTTVRKLSTLVIS
jgi:hypothetical protein